MNGWRTDCSLSWPRPETLGARSRVGQAEYALVVSRHDVGSGENSAVNDESGVAWPQSRAGPTAVLVEEQ